MPDVSVNVKVVGAQQVQSQLQPVSTALNTVGTNAGTATTKLNTVGTSMTTAGTKANTAGGQIQSMGTKISGMAASIGLLSTGLFSLASSYTNVQQANISAEKSVNKYNDTVARAEKAEKKYKDALKASKTATSDMTAMNNEAVKAMGYIEEAENNILVLQEQKRAALKAAGNDMNARIIIEKDFNDAIDQQKGFIEQNKRVISERDKAVKEGAPDQQKLNELYEDWQRKVDKINPALETMKLKQVGANQAQTEFYTSLLPNVALLGSAATGIVSFGKGLKPVGDGLGGAATKGGSFLRVIGPIGLALAAATAAFLAIKNNVFGFRDALNDLGEAVGKAVPGLKPFLDLIKGLGAAIGLAPDIKNWKDTVKTALDEIQKAVSAFVDPAKEKIGELVDSLGEFVGKITQGDIAGAFGVLASGVTKAFNDIKGAIMSVDWPGVWQSLKDATASTFEWIKTTGSNLGRDLGVIVKNWNWSDAWTSLTDAFTSTLNFLGGIVGPPLAAIGSAIYEFVAENGPAWWQSLKDAFNSSLQFLAQNIGPALAFVGGAISAYVIQNAPSWWKSLQEGFSAALEFLSTNIGPALSGLGSALSAYVVENAPAWWQSLQQGFSTALQTLSENIGPALQTVGSSIITYLTENAPGWFAGIGQAVTTALSSIDQETIVTGLQGLGRGIIQALQEYLTGAADEIISSFLSGILIAIQEGPEALASVGDAIVSGIISAPNAIVALGQGVVSWFSSALSEPTTAEGIAAGAGQAAQSWIGAFGQWMLENFPKSFAVSFQIQEEIKKAITGFANAVGDFFLTQVPEAFGEAGNTIVATIVHGITVSLPQFAQGILAQGAQIAGKIVEGLGEIGTNIVNKIISDVSSAITTAGQRLAQLGQQIANAIMGGLGQLGGILGLGGAQTPAPGQGGFVPRARGFGPAVVNTPTRMLVGEAGPELVSVVPMKGNRQWAPTKAAAAGMGYQGDYGAMGDPYQAMQEGSMEGTQQGFDQGMPGMQQAVQEGAQQGVQDGMAQGYQQAPSNTELFGAGRFSWSPGGGLAGGGSGAGQYPMAPSNTELWGAGRQTWTGGAMGTQLGGGMGGGAQYPVAPSNTELFGTGTRFTWTGGASGTSLGGAMGGGGGGFGGAIPPNFWSGTGSGANRLTANPGGTPAPANTGFQVPASYGKPLGRTINGIPATILPGQGPIRQAAIGMHERLRGDTLIQAHKNERVDITPGAQSNSGGSGIDQKMLDKLTKLLERMASQSTSYKIDFNVDGHKLSSAAAKNMGTAAYGDR